MTVEFNLKKITELVNIDISRNVHGKKYKNNLFLFLNKVLPFVYKIHNYSLGVILTRRVFCKKSVRKE